jgi:hypothetical protein
VEAFAAVDAGNSGVEWTRVLGLLSSEDLVMYATTPCPVQLKACSATRAIHGFLVGSQI